SDDDVKLFNKIRYELNKIKISNKNDHSFIQSVRNLSDIEYSQISHLEKLADLIVEKSINEEKFCSTYALICHEIADICVFVNDNKVSFRYILFGKCETLFNNIVENPDKYEQDKI